MRAALLLFVCFTAAVISGAEHGKKALDDRIYYLELPRKLPPKPKLFVWLHPANGNAQYQFIWWQRSRLSRSGTILLCPQAAGMGWVARRDEAYLTKVIAHVMKKYTVAPRRVYLGGHSSGAGFTWYYGLKNQKTFTALIPAAGHWHEGYLRPTADPPPDIYIYHSVDDNVIPYAYAEKAQKTLKKKGFTVHLVKDKRKHGLGPKLQTLVKQVLAKKPKPPPAQKKKKTKPPSEKSVRLPSHYAVLGR
jgi:hypothetical protein